ncbi:phosphoglycerate mutase-like protein [Saccharata proteae CBS 121410]|uniref:Phosphoglycerate mutase-like protein n=1 Tax=Saccharata proteae CBS 121410 TaxID=1314787 RepID=A0A9P4I2L2_9PEZI|nr:phosphoglycerate mutase-like protein [Saccharata proteae CBS 121410]
MAPIIHCVRHAQGFHNLGPHNHGMLDPLLTEFGKQQCEDLKKKFPYHERVNMVVASPIKRTVYTALLAFEPEIKGKSLKVIALPEIQETSDLPCDTGSPVPELKREFEDRPVDIGSVKDGWDSKKGPWAPTAEALAERARVARNWLREQKADEIVVVTHGGFLHYFTEDWTGFDPTLANEALGTGWANTEYRSYTFKPDTGDQASVVETEESRERRRGTEKPLTADEQRNLERTAQL